jgi:hypothetical protein
MNLTPFAALVKKDLLLFFKDRRSVMMSFAAPIAIASFFGLVLGGSLSKNERQRIHIWFVDEDRSAVSANIGARLGAEHAIEVKTGTAEASREEVRAGQAAAAVIIGKGFGAKAGGAMFGVPTNHR